MEPVYAFNVHAVNIKIDKKSVKVKREMEDGYQTVSTRIPALISISKGSNIRRLPSMQDVLASRKKPLKVVSADDLGVSEDLVGLKGSFTQVTKIFAPPSRTGGEIIDGSDPAIAAKKLFDFLVNNQLLKER